MLSQDVISVIEHEQLPLLREALQNVSLGGIEVRLKYSQERGKMLMDDLAALGDGEDEIDLDDENVITTLPKDYLAFYNGNKQIGGLCLGNPIEIEVLDDSFKSCADYLKRELEL